jgi:hypothetical protein
MHLKIDLTQVPPVVTLEEPDDFAAFKAVVVAGDHLHVSPEALTAIADRTDDADWQERLGAMVAYARSKGWTDDEGRVSAHVERVDR